MICFAFIGINVRKYRLSLFYRFAGSFCFQALNTKKIKWLRFPKINPLIFPDQIHKSPWLEQERNLRLFSALMGDDPDPPSGDENEAQHRI